MDKIISKTRSFLKYMFIGKNKKYLVLLLLLLLLIPVVVGRLYFIMITKDYRYKGTILSYYSYAGKTGIKDSELKFFFTNPNNPEDFVMIDIRKVLEKGVDIISFPVLNDGEIAFLIINDRDEMYVYRYKNEKQELLKLNGTIKPKRYLGDLHRFEKKLFFTQGNFIYEINGQNGNLQIVAENKKKNTDLLLSKDNVGYIKDDGSLKFLMKDKQEIKIRGELQGYFIQGEKLLVYDWERRERKAAFEGSYILDVKTGEMKEYSSHPYYILANGPEVTVMSMTAKKGKYQDFYDEEFTFGDLIHTNWRLCYVPFMYNTKTHDVINLPWPDVDMNLRFASYFTEDYNRAELERFRDFMYAHKIRDLNKTN